MLRLLHSAALPIPLTLPDGESTTLYRCVLELEDTSQMLKPGLLLRLHSLHRTRLLSWLLLARHLRVRFVDSCVPKPCRNAIQIGIATSLFVTGNALRLLSVVATCSATNRMQCIRAQRQSQRLQPVGTNTGLLILWFGGAQGKGGGAKDEIHCATALRRQ